MHLVDVLAECITIVAANGYVLLVVEIYSATSVCCDVFQIDDIGAMNAHKPVGW
jgi:hypothetical protein